MSYQTIPLQAGIPFRLDIAGKLILIDSPGVAGGVDIAIVRNGTPGPTMPDRKAAFRHVGQFDGVILTAAVNTDCALFLSFDDVQLGLADGAAVKIPEGVQITNTPAERVPVDVGGAVIEVTATNVEINNSNAAAVPTQRQALATIADHAAIVINAGAAQALIADPTLKRLRIKNAHASARVAIGGAAVTMATAAIILEPGDMWAEDDAAGAEWYATSDTAGADVRVMGLRA